MLDLGLKMKILFQNKIEKKTKMLNRLNHSF